MKNNDRFEYQLVCGAKDFFNNLAEQGNLDFKKKLSIPSGLETLINKVFTNFLGIVEHIIGLKLYVRADRSPLSLRLEKVMQTLLEKKIFKKIMKIPRVHYDEPHLNEYCVEAATAQDDIRLFSDGFGVSTLNGGSDFNDDMALLKAISEGIERFCLCVYRENNLLLSSSDKISSLKISPLSFAALSETQRQRHQTLRIDEKSSFYWTKCFSVPDNKSTLIPAQLVYIGYKYYSNEPIIRQQISTGAATYKSFDGALYRGICELIERDAFIITYLNKLSPPLIEFGDIDDKRLTELLPIFKRYNLELHLFDITTDIAVPSIMAVVFDKTGVGQAVQVVTKTDLSLKEAIIGAIFEAIQLRTGFRKIMSNGGGAERKKELTKEPWKIANFEDRCIFWSSVHMIDKISFLFNGKKIKINQRELDEAAIFDTKADKEKLKIVLGVTERNNINIFGLDIATEDIKELGFSVAKTLSPQLQPIYIDEGLKCLGGKRLYEVPVKLGYRNKPLREDELNLIPHPFL